MKPTLQDVICFDPPSPAKPKDSAQGTLLVFFITGNPGLIAYYGPFLDRLQSLLRKEEGSRGDSKCYTYGASLAGFEVNSDKSPKSHSSSSIHDAPYGLQEQIDQVAARLEHVAGSVKSSEGQRVPVILVGHSVGSYILLEIVSKWQKRRRTEHSLLPFDIIGGICLFPTVVDIAKSPAGRRMTPLLDVPAFPTAVHYIARPFHLLPFWVVVYLVALITGMPNNMATVTAAFLCSANGVQQALHMARDEMHEITDDKFSDDVWGTSGAEGDEAKVLQSKATAVVSKQADDASSGSHMRRPTTKLHFYWGKNDHWVADNTRDSILAARAQKATNNQTLEKAKPVMEIDQHDIPHGFCLKPEHSNLVAEKVANWVKEIRTNHVSYQRNAL